MNLDAGIWRYLEYVKLRNVRCATRWDLQAELRLAVRRLRRKRQIVRACCAHAGCL